MRLFRKNNGMKRSDTMQDSITGLTKSKPDANRLYSILLDARASSISENMFDVAEKLLSNEKTNAQNALEQLTSLKKNMQTREENGTIDLMVTFFQDKVDILRAKEEHIKKISRDSRDLLEQKRKSNAEIASIKQDLSDCVREVNELNSKLDKLKIKEQELTLIEGQLKKELLLNENEVVNGLYEIILAHQQPQYSENAAPAPLQQAAATAFTNRPRPADAPPAAVRSIVDDDTDLPFELDAITSGIEKPEAASIELYKRVEPPEPPPYPKSVVKTTKGTVIGEYYYDGQVYKNKRHYIFNSLFFIDQLAIGLSTLKKNNDAATHGEVLQMIQDTYKRITGSATLHFEVSTNEILNEKTLKDLWLQLKQKSYDDVANFCSKLKAKIEVLGSNYKVMLHEQMDRLVQGL